MSVTGSPVSPVTVQSATTSQIRQMILDGRLAPGERLHQDRLAESLKVSRMPVREAIRQLASEGLVTIVAHRGAFVASLDPNEIRELYQVRSVLECLAVRQSVPRMGDETIADLKQLLEQMRALEHEGSEEPTIALDREFHERLMAPAQMDYLLGLIRQSRQKTEAFRRAHTYIPGRSHISNEEHEHILAAVSARDAALAEQLVDEHLTNAANHLIAFLSS